MYLQLVFLWDFKICLTHPVQLNKHSECVTLRKELQSDNVTDCTQCHGIPFCGEYIPI